MMNEPLAAIVYFSSLMFQEMLNTSIGIIFPFMQPDYLEVTLAHAASTQSRMSIPLKPVWSFEMQIS